MNATEGQTEYFQFVMNVACLTDAETYDLGHGMVLRRPTAHELSVIRDVLDKLDPSPLRGTPTMWERHYPITDGIVTRAPELEFKFFVISFHEATPEQNFLRLAFNLCRCELGIGFTVSVFPNGGRGYSQNPGYFLRATEFGMHRAEEAFFLDVSAADIKEIVATAAMLETANSKFFDVPKLAGRLMELRLLPPYSPLLFLGYFSILESILTHLPDPSDPYDSITRQVKKKVALLNSRFDKPLNYATIGGAGSDTIWGAMYHLRSCIAHGSTPDFERGKLTLLSDFDTALALIKETTKKVVRHCLREPELVHDLREC